MSRFQFEKGKPCSLNIVLYGKKIVFVFLCLGSVKVLKRNKSYFQPVLFIEHSATKNGLRRHICVRDRGNE